MGLGALRLVGASLRSAEGGRSAVGFPMNLALFDFDGTVTEGDTYSPFLRFAVQPRRAVVGGALVFPFVMAYRLGLVSAGRVRPIVARACFQGAGADEVRALGRRFAIEVVPKSLRPNALQRIHWHQTQGDTVVIVSASLDVYLSPWCESMGLRCICTELEERDGRLTGRYRAGDCSGSRKVDRIREHYDLNSFPVVYAYGDTADDKEMLDLAHRKYFRWKEVD